MQTSANAIGTLVIKTLPHAYSFINMEELCAFQHMHIRQLKRKELKGKVGFEAFFRTVKLSFFILVQNLVV